MNDFNPVRLHHTISNRTSSDHDNNNRISSYLHHVKNTLSAYMNGKIHLTITREDEQLQVKQNE